MDGPANSVQAMFQRTLQMGERLARILTAGGIATLEELAYVPIAELLQIEGLAESDAQLYRKLARARLLHDAMGDEDGADPVDA